MAREIPYIAAVQFALEDPFPEPEAAARQDYVYA